MVARSNRFRFGRARRLRLTTGPDGERCILVASTTYAVFVSGSSSPVGFEPRETVRLYAPGCRRVRRQMVGADELPARKRSRSRPATAHGSADKPRPSAVEHRARTRGRERSVGRNSERAGTRSRRLQPRPDSALGTRRLLAEPCHRTLGETDRAGALQRRVRARSRSIVGVGGNYHAEGLPEIRADPCPVAALTRLPTNSSNGCGAQRCAVICALVSCYRGGRDRGSPNHGSTLLSKWVIAEMRSPVRVRTMRPVP